MAARTQTRAGKKSVLASLTQFYMDDGGMTKAAAETRALCDEQYTSYVQHLCEARHEAILAKIEYEARAARRCVSWRLRHAPDLAMRRYVFRARGSSWTYCARTSRRGGAACALWRFRVLRVAHALHDRAEMTLL